MARQSAHSHASRIPSSGRNGSALLVEALPQTPSDSLLSRLSVKRLTALLHVPFGTLFTCGGRNAFQMPLPLFFLKGRLLIFAQPCFRNAPGSAWDSL